jgi:ribosomal protein S8
LNLYKGKLVVDIVTAVETDTEEVMTEKAHEGFATELFDEIMALLGAKGYCAKSIGATLKNAGKADEVQLKLIESNKKEAIKAVEKIYSKANRSTYYIQM